MKDLRKVVLAASLGMMVATMSTAAFAHHAVNSQFDVTKNLLFEGTMTKFELINPHSYVHLDRKLPNGKVESWSFETGAPAAIKRAGLSAREAWKRGETYKLSYSPARDGSHTGLMNAFVLPDGRIIGFGSAQNVDAAKKLLKK